MINDKIIHDFFNNPNFVVVSCESEEQAKELLANFGRLGYRWCNGLCGGIYDENTTYFAPYEGGTCYTNKGGYSQRKFYEDHPKYPKIIPFKKFAYDEEDHKKIMNNFLNFLQDKTLL